MLHENWLTDYLIDFEYKKYLLLGYFKEVEGHLKAIELYPSLIELNAHYEKLNQIRNLKESLHSSFKKDVVAIDLQNVVIRYRNRQHQDKLMDEVEQIIDFAYPRFKFYLIEATNYFGFVQQNMTLEPIGVEPIYKDEGFVLTHYISDKNAQVYRYTVSLFDNVNTGSRTIHYKHLTNLSYSLTTTPLSVKRELSTADQSLPNPATYIVESKLKFPENETFAPVAIRMLDSYLSNFVAVA